MEPEIKRFYAWIGPSNGYAAINWQANPPFSGYDWVGIYENDGKGDDDYLTWQWVSKGSPYVTSNIIASFQNVRYFIWEAAAEGSTKGAPLVSLDEVTPASLLASISGGYKEVMRSSGLDLEGQVNAQGEYTLHPGCWVTCSSGGYAELNWTAAKSPDSYDWVALYSDVDKSNDDYISGAWQWAENSSPYVTSQGYSPGMHARYIKAGSPYIALRRSKPIAKGYFDLQSMYTPTDRRLVKATAAADLQKILKIMADQLQKAVNWEPSVFSPGLWPFPENLLFKNLSYAEIDVIRQKLYPSQYYDVIMVYYETYRMAIQIADDGERNAKRHAFWQISMMQKFGLDFAKAIGNAHEIGRPGTKEDNRVDDLNNAAALKYASEHPGVDPATAANTMWSESLLSDYNDKVAPEHTKDEL
ncbi:hypothetical protein ACROYT_G000195 [Oculina patagonica]